MNRLLTYIETALLAIGLTVLGVGVGCWVHYGAGLAAFGLASVCVVVIAGFHRK